MKYLLFADSDRDYGCTKDVVLVGSRRRGFGAYDDKDAKILKELAPEGHISDLTKEQYEELKKKLSQPSVSFKLLGMVEQDPSKDPNAVYAKAEEAVPSKKPKKKPAKSLVKVGKAKVEDPLEGKK